MTDPELGAAYRHAFTDTEEGAVRRMRDFVETLPSGRRPQPRRTRWMLPVIVAAAVAVVVTTVAVAAGASHPAGLVGTARGGAQPVIVSEFFAHPSAPRTANPPSTRSTTQLTTGSALSTGPHGPTSQHSAAATPARSAVSPSRSLPSTRPASPMTRTAATSGPPDTSTYPPIGDPGITGPLTPYAKASSYTTVPAGLVVRAPADSVSLQNGVATEFSIYISAANADPKTVVGGYLVIVAAPSIDYQSIDGQGPSSTPAGVAVHLGNRLWHWNAHHTLLMWTSADADVYIGVLATRAMNEFEPTIPTGYSTADIELIAAGLRG